MAHVRIRWDIVALTLTAGYRRRVAGGRAPSGNINAVRSNAKRTFISASPGR